MAASHCGQQNIRQLVIDRGLLTAEEFDELTSPERVTRLGSNHGIAHSGQ